MCQEEFEYWQAFNLLEPIGVLREDLLTASIVKSALDIAAPNNPYTLSDCTIFKERNPDSEPTLEETMNNVKAIFGAKIAEQRQKT